ncbi:MAG: PilC/PilY family type IV pilus protein [Ideonella sp.]|nr:PilC/PilY family type IV pilus protein [Ideonella sp.]
MVWSKSAVVKVARWTIGLGSCGVLAWAVAQSVVKSPLGSYLEISGQVIAPSNSQAINSTYDVEPFDTIRWTSYFDTRIATPFESEGELTLPVGHTWVAGSVLKPANTALLWQVSNAWTDKEPASGSAVTAVKWLYSTKFKTATGTIDKSVNFAGTGDGYRIIPYGTNLYVVNHHLDNGTPVKCRQASNGLNCKGWSEYGEPLPLSNGGYGGTPNNPLEALNYKTGEMFVGVTHSTGSYITCLNLNNRQACGSWRIGDGTSYTQLTNFNTIGSKYYVLTNSAQLVCFDIEKRELCGTTAYPGSFSGWGTSAAVGHQLFFSANASQLFCHDSNSNQACAGWTTAGIDAGGGAGAYPIVNPNGTPRGACTNSGQCVGNDGQRFSAPAGYKTFLSTYTFLGSAYHNLNAIKESRLYAAGSSTVGCWDAKTDSSCGSWPSAARTPYTTHFDPTRKDCLMVIGDDANAAIFDVNDGGACKTVNIPKETELTFDPRLDYFKCDGSRSKVTAWGQLRISPSLPWGGQDGLTDVLVTLRDANGALLPENFSPKRKLAQNSYVMDIGPSQSNPYPAIPYADYPALKITLEFQSAGSLPQEAAFGVDLTYAGDPIQVCVATKAPAAPNCQVQADVRLKSRAIDKAGEGYSEEQTASKIMSPGGLSTGYAAFSSPTTARLNLSNLGPRDPRTQVVQGRWSLQYFSGDLWAFNVKADGQLDGSSFKTAQDVSKVPSLRKVFTARPTDNASTQSVAALDWANLADVQRETLNLNHEGVRDNQGVSRLAYLKGTDGNSFRARNGFTLGPVINSAPVILPTWASESRPEAQFPGFTAYRKTLPRDYPLAIYGGNDGALHAFEARGDSLSEAWTFVPDVMLRRAADYSDLNPAEIRKKPYFVDNVPIVGHANLGTDANPDWRAVAVILYGRGARAITALDVSNGDLSKGKGVLFEYTAASAPDLKDLGKIISQPDNSTGQSSAQLVRLSDKRSAVLVGNGIESNDSQAGSDQHSGKGTPVLYAFYLDKPASGAKYRAWSLGDKNVWPGIAAEPDIAYDNGLSTPTPVDTDNDGQIDVVYAGDMKGNLWRFDVKNPAAVTATRLFKTALQQPISQAPYVQVNPQGKNCGAADAKPQAKRCWQVVFSTGAALSPLTGDKNVATQSIYGVLDQGKGAQVSMNSLTPISYETYRVIKGVEYRALKPTTVNYGDKLGWRVDLGIYEHGVGAPRLQPTGLVMFSSLRPTTPGDATNVCVGPRSWLNEVDPLHGYSPIVAFDTNGDGSIDGQDRFDPDSATPRSPTSMAVSGSQFGPPAILRSASTQSQQMSLLLPSLGQDTGQTDSWSGGPGGGGSNPAPGSNSKALTHSNKANLGRMTWREKY